MPDANIPFDATIFTICGIYYELGDMKKANELAKKLFDIYEGDLRIYSSQKPSRRNAYGRDVNQAKEILRRLTGMAQQNKQQDLYNEFSKRIQSVLSPEDLAPPTAEPAIP